MIAAREVGAGLVLRPAVAADRDAIAELHAASWSSAYRGMMTDAFLDGPVVADRRAVWERRFAGPIDPDQVTVVAEQDGELEGFCCILAGHDPELGSLIDNLHVRPGGTRRRLGRRLLLAATNRMVEAGRSPDRPMHIFVLDANTRATGAYEGWGGRLDERFESIEADGTRRWVRRYGWPDPAALLAGLAAAPA